VNILNRYIIKEILKLLFPLWAGLALLIFFFDWLTRVFKWDVAPGLVTYILALKIPSYLHLVFPVAAIFACLAVVGGMNRAREIVAAQSFGVSNRRIFISCVVAILLATVPFYFVLQYGSPATLKVHYDLYDTKIKKRPSRIAKIINEKLWHRNGDYLYNVKYFDYENKTLKGITIYKFTSDFELEETLFAKRAQWLNSKWVLFDGATTMYSSDSNNPPLMEEFASVFTSVLSPPGDITRTVYTPDAMTSEEITNTIERHRRLGVDTTPLEVIYHTRWSYMIVAFLFLFFSFPRMVRFRRSSSLAKDSTFVIIISITYWFFYTTGINLGNKGTIAPLLAAWFPSILFFGIMYFYNRTQTTLQKTSE